MRFRAYTNGGYGFKGIDAAGGTMTLPLKLLQYPTGPMDAVSRSYVETEVSSLDASAVTGVFDPARLPAFTGTDIQSLGGGVFTLTPTGVVPGAYGKVNVNSKGRITGGSNLAAEDVPPLTWGKLVGTPTTLEGYGITDVVSLSGGVMTGPLNITPAPTQGNHLANKAYVDNKIGTSGGTVFVTGDIVYKTVFGTPDGYLRCNGGELSKTTYAALYSIIGDKYNTPGYYPGFGKPWERQYDINSTQNGDITGWIQGTSIPSGLSRHRAIATKNRAYLLGGYINGTATDKIYTAVINPDGTLGVWVLAPVVMPVTGTPQGVFVAKGYLYFYNGSTDLYYRTVINADGTLSGNWLTSPIWFTAQKYAVVATKDLVYQMGNHSDSDMSRATIAQDGVLGSWDTLYNRLPAAAPTRQVAITKNRIYILGGGDSGGIMSSIYSAPIDNYGVIGTWITAGNLPTEVEDAAVFVTRNKIYLIGGTRPNSSGIGKVSMADINLDGTIGTWSEGTPLPGELQSPEIITTSSRIYLLGGELSVYPSAGPTTKVYTAPIAGSLSDYSPYYNGIIVGGTPTTNFCLPDLTQSDQPGTYSYIKY